MAFLLPTQTLDSLWNKTTIKTEVKIPPLFLPEANPEEQLSG